MLSKTVWPSLSRTGSICLALAGLAACGPETENAAREPAPAAAPAPRASGPGADEAPGEVARRLAGLAESVEPNGAWARHGRRVDEIWSELERRHLRPMRAFARDELAPMALPTAPLFYPFSGPDLVSALQFFPDASSYLLVGLEPPGEIPRPDELAPAELEQELERLRGGLEHLVEAGYFVTTRMERDFAGPSRLDGFLPVLYLFLAHAGLEPVAVRHVELGPGGEVLDAAAGTSPRGVEIVFGGGDEGGVDEGTGDEGNGDGERRTLYYFAQDLSDEGLQQAPAFVAFASAPERFNAYLKSASYLLHTPEFSTLRGLLLAGAQTLLQDDSGVPYRHLDPDVWQVRFFGDYVATHPGFRDYFQEDLRAAYAEAGSEPLSFAIGYSRRISGSVLIWAERRSRAASR